VLAGAIGAASVLGGAFTSPLWAPVVDLGSAAVTAGIAAHAVHSSRDVERGADGPSTRHVLRHAATAALGQPDAPLAAHVIDVACRARTCDSRALRSAAMLVGRCFETHARGIAMGLAASWCAPLRQVSRVIDSARVARAAMANAELVRAVHETALAQADSARVVAELPLVPWFTSAAVPESFDDLEDMEEAA
jgi:hypothetical protein